MLLMKSCQLLCFYFFLLVVGCKDNGYSHLEFSPPVFKDSVYVKTEIFNDTIYTRMAWGMASYKDYIILLANIDECQFQLYNKETGERVKGFGRLGRGPQEILPVSNFHVNESRGILTSYFQAARQILVFHLDSIIQGKEHFMDKIQIQECTDMTFLEALPVHRNLLLYGGKCEAYPNGARFSFFSDRGEYLSAYDEYPVISTSDSLLQASNWLDLNLTRTVSPDGRKFAEATRLGGIMEIFEVTDSIKPVALKGFYRPHFYLDNGRQIYTEKTQFGFYYLNSSDRAIYALSFNGANSEMLPSCDLQMFDWLGNPVKKYKADKMLLNVCVDEKRHKAYALSQTPMRELILVSFDL